MIILKRKKKDFAANIESIIYNNMVEYLIFVNIKNSK